MFKANFNMYKLLLQNPMFQSEIPINNHESSHHKCVWKSYIDATAWTCQQVSRCEPEGTCASKNRNL